MKKICAILTLAASTLMASPLEVAIKKRSERELEKKETFIRQQNNLRNALGWGSATSQTKSTRGGTGSLTGKIGHNIDGYVSYSVYLYDEFGYEVDENYSSTDSFTFENLYPGKYTYKINSYNYPQKWYGNVSSGTEATFISLFEGQNAKFDSMYVEWQKPTVDSMIIHGTMTKEGTPLANANINLVYNFDEGGSSSHSSSTDENGNYEIAITGKNGDNCHILVRAYTYDEPNTIPLWIDGSPINEECPSVIFTDSLKADLSYSSGGTISGKITAGLTEFNSVSISAYSKEGYQFGSAGSKSNDSTYTISGLPDGEYYLRFGDYFTYKEEFYPNTTNHEDAQLISVKKGAITNIDATVSKKDGDTGGDKKEETVFIKGSVVDSKGNPVIVEYATIDYGLSGHSSSCNNSKFLVSAYADSSFKVTVVINDIYLTKAYWENGKDTSLTTGDTLEVLITLPDAGSVAGTFPLIENVDTSSGLSVGTSILLTADLDTVSTHIDESIPGKYRVPSVPAGAYTLSTVPVLINESGKSLSQKPTGAIQTTPLSVTVKNRETAIQNITGTPASGMISGTYTFDGAGAEWIYYAIRPDGSIASIGMAFTEHEDVLSGGDYYGLLPRNWDIWSSQQTGTLPKTIKGDIDIPLLTSGDYYIFLGYWDESLDEDDDDILKGIWYGQDTPVKVSMDSVFLDELGAIVIPSDAEKINLAANDTWVKGINFGSTGILQKLISSHSQSIVRATKSELSLQHLTDESRVELFTLGGRRVINKELGTVNSTTIKHSFAAGTYLLKINSVAGQQIQKIRIP